MKKIVLSVVFLVTMIIQINAESNMVENEINQIHELPSCLIDAYNNANQLEAESEGGPYSWTHEQWTAVFEMSFGVCQALEEDNSGQ